MKLLDELRKDPEKGIADAKTMCREAKKLNPKVTLADVEKFFLADPISHIRDKRGFNSYILPTLPDNNITWILPTSLLPQRRKIWTNSLASYRRKWRWRTMMLYPGRMQTRGGMQTRGKKEGGRRHDSRGETSDGTAGQNSTTLKDRGVEGCVSRSLIWWIRQ